jgi:hypothetical protein
MSEVCIHISDMTAAAPPLNSQMTARIDGAPSGHVWTPLDFLDLGARDAVDKALQRRAGQGALRRIDRGLYDQPSFNRLTQSPNPPDPKAMIDAVARRDQIRLLVDGMTAANDLGFTDAVPAKIVVHTDARLRPIQLGQMTITFKPTAPSKLTWAGRPAMRLVQALHWLRDTNGQGDADRLNLGRVADILSDPRHGPAVKTDLTKGFPTLPAWMQDLLRPHLADHLARAARAPSESASMIFGLPLRSTP